MDINDKVNILISGLRNIMEFESYVDGLRAVKYIHNNVLTEEFYNRFRHPNVVKVLMENNYIVYTSSSIDFDEVYIGKIDIRIRDNRKKECYRNKR